MFHFSKTKLVSLIFNISKHWEKLSKETQKNIDYLKQYEKINQESYKMKAKVIIV